MRDSIEKSAKESLVLPAYQCANKSDFLCDLIAFVFFIKGQCPSFNEVEKEVKMIVSEADSDNKQRSNPNANVNKLIKRHTANSSRSSTAVTVCVTPAKTSTSTNGNSSALFTCYASPIECKFQARNYAKQEATTLFTCYTSPILSRTKNQPTNFKPPILALQNKKPLCASSKEEVQVSFINENFDSISLNISIDLSQTLEFDSFIASAKKQFALRCASPAPLLHLKRNVHQERMLRCLAEVVPAVLRAAPHSDAIMLAFGPSLLSLDQAVLLEFADASELDHGDKENENVDADSDSLDDDEDDRGQLEAGLAQRQRQLVFSQLLGVSGLADAIPLTSMHVLLRLPRDPAQQQQPPTAPFRPRPHFKLRPACRLIKLTLPWRVASSASSVAEATDCIWYHSATSVPGYALPELG